MTPLPADFEGIVRILTREQGGRKSPVFNGIRWDFRYAEGDPDGALWMIPPDFVDETGKSLPQDRPLPVDVELPASFRILDAKLKVEVHRLRLREGVRFFCHEGNQRMAEGRVTRITGLHPER